MIRSRAWAMPCLVAVVASLGVGLATSSPFSSPAHASQAGSPPASVLESAEHLSAAFEYVADTIAPSVVTIRTTREVQPQMPQLRGPDSPFFNSPFRDFFGRELVPQLEAPRQPRVQMGEGSGVIVTNDGYILTNSHVVAGADDVSVVFADDREYPAEVIGADPKTDIAVIKVDADDLVAARLGNSDDLRVGQWVVAAGNPFGLSSTITTGIVSAKGRSRVGITDYEDFIQTDAAINRGNSGGPLTNLRGEVIGINTAILSGSGGSIGIGFAIPINMAKDVMQELIDEGRVVRGYLGVLIQDLTDGMAKSFGFDGTDGALVSEVPADGPAADAGIQPGDIITRVDGKRVTDVTQLRLHVAALDPGTTVELDVFRDKKRRSIDVTIGELPGDSALLARDDGDRLDLGLRVETLRPDAAQRFGVASDVRGVVVMQVSPVGAAARSGLQAGDVITHVHETVIETERQFVDALRKADLGEGVRLTVQRSGQRRYIFIQRR